MGNKTKTNGKPAPGSKHWEDLKNELFNDSDRLSGNGPYNPAGLINPRKRRDESKKSGWWNG